MLFNCHWYNFTYIFYIFKTQAGFFSVICPTLSIEPILIIISHQIEKAWTRIIEKACSFRWKPRKKHSRVQNKPCNKILSRSADLCLNLYPAQIAYWSESDFNFGPDLCDWSEFWCKFAALSSDCLHTL